MARRLSPDVVPRAGPRRGSATATVSPSRDDLASKACRGLAEHSEEILSALRRRRDGLSPRPSPRGARQPEPPGRGASCFLRVCGAGHRYRRSSPGGRRPSPRGTGAMPRRRCRDASSRSSGPHRAKESPMSVCSPGRCAPGNGWSSVAARSSEATQIKVFAPQGSPRRDFLAPGEMAAVRGLGSVRVGDADGGGAARRGRHARFPRPALEAVVFARDPAQQGSLRAALSQLAEQDPLIDVRQDDAPPRDRGVAVRRGAEGGYRPTLEREYGIAADFRETTVVCIERPARVGEAEEILSAKTHTNITGRSSPLSTNPFRATLALRIEPAAPGSGVEFRSDVEVRFVPLYVFNTIEAFRTQMESYAREALAEGLFGWQVTDCTVTMTDCGYGAPATGAADFRLLTQLVLANALQRAGTWVCEPLADVIARDAGIDRPGRPRDAGSTRRSRPWPVLGERPDARRRRSCPWRRSERSSTSCQASRWGKESLKRAPAAISRSARTRPSARAHGPSPLDRDAWLASLSQRG